MDTPKQMLTLGIETSCDETAASIVDGDGRVHSACLRTQSAHRKWGGVVPEVAARAHIDLLDRLIIRSLKEARVTFNDLELIAAGCGPGLIGGVLVGCGMAKGIAIGGGKRFIAVNHLAAHSLAVRLQHRRCEFPFLTLLASGGHCLFAVVKAANEFVELGSTIDDAAGEAFDKTARLLGLGFPGGSELEKLARDGDENRFALPRPLLKRNGCDFSFSGLKTAVRRLVEKHQAPDRRLKADIAASFQRAMVDIMVSRSKNAIAVAAGAAATVAAENEEGMGIKSLVFCGGVAANQPLRSALAATAAAHSIEFYAPSPQLCTDNATMIAWGGIELARVGVESSLAVEAAARLPITSPNGDLPNRLTLE